MYKGIVVIRFELLILRLLLFFNWDCKCKVENFSATKKSINFKDILEVAVAGLDTSNVKQFD